MTETTAYPGYATPTFTFNGGRWFVDAHPQGERLGWVDKAATVGWTAVAVGHVYVGLFPDKQAAGEALVKHAGYEVLR